jgi:hypothetical protein
MFAAEEAYRPALPCQISQAPAHRLPSIHPVLIHEMVASEGEWVHLSHPQVINSPAASGQAWEMNVPKAAAAQHVTRAAMSGPGAAATETRDRAAANAPTKRIFLAQIREPR